MRRQHARLSAGMALAGTWLWASCTTPYEPLPERPPVDGVPLAWQALESSEGPPSSTWVADLSNAPADPLLASRAEYFEGGEAAAQAQAPFTLADAVDEAMQANFGLAATEASVRSAAAQVRIAGAARLPQASLSLDASRRRTSFEFGENVASTTGNSFNAAGTLQWEVDLWQRLSNTQWAAQADFESALVSLRGARLSLAGNVARAWYRLIEAQLQLKLARQTARNFEDNTALLRNRFRRGITQALDLRLSESQAANARAAAAQAQRIYDETRRALETLLGRYPRGALEVPRALPDLEALPIAPGSPMELLSRRPDVRAAELDLLAADARLRAASRALYPSLDLTGSLGTASAQAEELLDSDFWTGTLAAGILQPIFLGGRLRAEADLRDSAREAAWQSFGEALLTAWREVETTLAAEGFYAQQETALEEATAASDSAEDIAWERYQAGIVDINTALDAQRRAFDNRSRLISVKSERIRNRIDLYVALGGDFGPGAGAPVEIKNQSIEPAPTGKTTPRRAAHDLDTKAP